MTPALLGRKLGMTRVYDASGTVVPVTVVEAGPCAVTQVKTVETDGYHAVQLGFVETKARHSTMPLIGHAAKAGVGPRRHFREVRLKAAADVAPGATLKVDVFKGVDFVDVIGTSKGKGTAGVMKRHHFGGGSRTHGQSDRERAPGSIGSSSFPSRVFKGLRMAGRMGGTRVTVRNLKVVGVIPDSNLLLVKGSVPGAVNGYVEIHKVVAH